MNDINDDENIPSHNYGLKDGMIHIDDVTKKNNDNDSYTTMNDSHDDVPQLIVDDDGDNEDFVSNSIERLLHLSSQSVPTILLLFSFS